MTAETAGAKYFQEVGLARDGDATAAGGSTLRRP